MDRADLVKQQLSAASPLELAKTLKEIELYDKKESQQVFDEIYAKFQNGNNQVDTVLKPVMLNVFDSLMESAKPLRDLRKKGLTASRIWNECEFFSYEKEIDVNSNPDAYQELKNMREQQGWDGDVTSLHYVYGATGKDARGARKTENEELLGTAKYKNSNMEDFNSTNRPQFFDSEPDKKGYKEGYFGDKDSRRDEYQQNILNKDNSNTDHIIPLSRVHDQFAGNMALNSEDIKRMANQPDNYAMTSQSFNDSKNDQLNEEMQTYKRDDLPEKTKQRMRIQSEEAQDAVNAKANEFVFDTLAGKGNVSIKFSKEEREALNRETEKEIAAMPNATKEERTAVYERIVAAKLKERQLAKRDEVCGNLARAAGSQSKDYALGNLIIFALKPIVYEIKDIIKNGLEKGVKIKGKISAIKKRFGRVKNYVMNNFVSEALGIAKDFVKMFISSLIEGVINLFVGFYKMIFKILKEGVKIFVKACKIMWGEEGKNLSEREKGDAVLKLIGVAVGSIIGIGIEQVLASLAVVPGWARLVLASLLSGLVSTLFMHTLDKLDFFSVKSEKRRKAVEQVFNERIREVEAATKAMDATAVEILGEQEKAFNGLSASINNGLHTGNMEQVQSDIKNLARFFKVELPYGNFKEFVKAYDESEYLSLDV